MDTRLPDAAPDNWVDRRAPRGLKPWLKLARLDRPTGIWLLMLPGWQGIALADAMRGRWPDVRLLAAFFFGAVLMRAAGCAVNDAADRDLDAKVARTAGRPVASGRISRRAALLFALACTAAGALIVLFFNLTSLWLAIAALPLVAIYPLMKRITWWPQAWLGLTFNWGALLGFAAAQGGRTKWEWLPALLLYASGIAWTLGYDTLYAVQDVEGDALAGVKSSARRLGPQAPAFVAAAYGVSLVLLVAMGFAARLGLLFFILLPAAAVTLFLQLRGIAGARPEQALAAFKTNTWVGLILFAAVAVSRWRP